MLFAGQMSAGHGAESTLRGEAWDDPVQVPVASPDPGLCVPVAEDAERFDWILLLKIPRET
jgi:hypothetical protein